MLLAALLISSLELQNIEFTNNHFGHLTTSTVNQFDEKNFQVGENFWNNHTAVEIYSSRRFFFSWNQCFSNLFGKIVCFHDFFCQKCVRVDFRDLYNLTKRRNGMKIHHCLLLKNGITLKLNLSNMEIWWGWSTSSPEETFILISNPPLCQRNNFKSLVMERYA